jgi:hypothetical protein
VAVAGGDDEVHAVDVALHREVHVALDAATEARDRRVQVEAGDAANRLALAGARARAAGFDDGDAGVVELARDGRLLVGGQRDAGGLFAVAQRGVEELYVGCAAVESGRETSAGEFLGQPP